MRRIICFVFLLFMGFEAVRADDVKVKLNSADGSTSFQVRDSADIVVSSITSVGDATFATVSTTHSITAGSDIRIKGNDIFFGDSQTDRKIYDDSTNFRTCVSSNVDIAGDITVGTDKVKIDDSGNIYPGSSSGINTARYIYDDSTNYATRFSSHVYVAGYTLSKNNTMCVPILASNAYYNCNNYGDTDISNLTTAVDPYAIDSRSNPQIQIKLLITKTNTSGTNNIAVHNVTDSTYPITYTELTWTGNIVYSGWEDETATIDSVIEYALHIDQSSSGNIDFDTVYLLIRPKP